MIPRWPMILENSTKSVTPPKFSGGSSNLRITNESPYFVLGGHTI